MRNLKEWRKQDQSGAGMTVEQLRAVKEKHRRAVTLSLHPCSGKWALRYHFPWNFSFSHGWVLSEKSRRVRSFATADAAISVARTFGQSYIRVDLEIPPEVANVQPVIQGYAAHDSDQASVGLRSAPVAQAVGAD